MKYDHPLNYMIDSLEALLKNGKELSEELTEEEEMALGFLSLTSEHSLRILKRIKERLED